MLIFHIVIAVMSLALSTYLIAKPAKELLKVSYGLISVTTLSGVALMVANPAYAIRGCIAYMTYTAVVVALTVRAKKSLAYEHVDQS
jgi:hypothetical protein